MEAALSWWFWLMNAIYGNDRNPRGYPIFSNFTFCANVTTTLPPTTHTLHEKINSLSLEWNNMIKMSFKNIFCNHFFLIYETVNMENLIEVIENIDIIRLLDVYAFASHTTSTQKSFFRGTNDFDFNSITEIWTNAGLVFGIRTPDFKETSLLPPLWLWSILFMHIENPELGMIIEH